VTALIDTGAATSVMSCATMDKVCISRPPLLTPVNSYYAINGTKCNVKGETEIKFMGARPVKVIIVDYVGHDFILGNDALIAGKTLLDLSNRTMQDV